MIAACSRCKKKSDLGQFKQCERCRAYSKSPARKAALERYAKTDKRKAAVKRYHDSARTKEWRDAYCASERGKDTRRRAARKYCQTDRGKERLLAYQRSERGMATARKYAQSTKGKAQALLANAKMRAHALGLPFDIDVDDVAIPDTCPLLNVEISWGSGRKGRRGPSLDRILPQLGYIKGNVWVISDRANAIKNDASIEELERLTANLRKKLGPP